MPEQEALRVIVSEFPATVPSQEPRIVVLVQAALLDELLSELPHAVRLNARNSARSGFFILLPF